MEAKRNHRLKINVKDIAPILILISMVIILSSLNREFLTLRTLLNLMRQVSSVGVVALGAMIVIISGGIDFTTGFGLAMIGMAAGTVFENKILGGSTLVVVLTCLIGGALLGSVNGLLIARLKVVPFIATLAVMSLAQGMSMLIGRGKMVMIRNSPLLWFGQGRLGSIPVSFVLFAFMALLAYAILKHTRMGTYIYAMGDNEESVRYAGVNVSRYKFLVYVLAGIFTGAAALITVSQLGLAAPNIGGSTLLDAIAAAVLGGTSLRGGRGTVFGTFIGTIIIVLITTALTYLNIRPELQDFFKGSVILLALALDVIIDRVSEQRSRQVVSTE